MSERSWSFRGLYMISSYRMVGSGWDNWFHRDGELQQQKRKINFFVCFAYNLLGWNFLLGLASTDISKMKSANTLHQQWGITKRFGKGNRQQNNAMGTLLHITILHSFLLPHGSGWDRCLSDLQNKIPTPFSPTKLQVQALAPNRDLKHFFPAVKHGMGKRSVHSYKSLDEELWIKPYHNRRLKLILHTISLICRLCKHVYKEYVLRGSSKIAI